MKLFEDGQRDDLKQGKHTKETQIVLEHDLKSTLENLVFDLFGKGTIIL